METLAARVERDGPLEAGEAAALVARLARALEEPHQRGEAHGAIQPESLVLRREDGTCVLKASSRCSPSFHYQTRERIHGGPASAADDVWALGAILYFSLTGSAPFPGERPTEVASRIELGSVSPLAVFDAGDDDMQDLVEGIFLPKKSERIETVDRVRKTLAIWLAKRGIAPGPPIEVNEGDRLSLDVGALPPPPKLPDMEDRPTLPRSDLHFTFADEDTTLPHDAGPYSMPSPGASTPLASRLPPTSELLARAKAAQSKAPEKAASLPSPKELAERLRAPSMPSIPRLNPPKALERSKSRSERPPAVGTTDPSLPLAPLRPLPPPPAATGSTPGSRGPLAPLPPPPPSRSPAAPAPSVSGSTSSAPSTLASNDEIPEPLAPILKPPIAPPSASVLAQLASLLEPDDDASERAPVSEPPSSKAPSSKPISSKPVSSEPVPSSAAPEVQGSPSDSAPPPAVPGLPPPPSRVPRSRREAAVPVVATAEAETKVSPRSPGLSRRWGAVAVVGAVAVGAGIGIKLFSRDDGSPPTMPTATASTQAAPPSTPPVVLSMPSATASAASPPIASASASSVEVVTPPPPVDVNACVSNLFAADSFGETQPELGFVCREPDPRAGSQKVHEALVRAGMKRTVSDGMREWAIMGWYELAAYSALRGRCCPDAPPLELPPSPGTCGSMQDALNDIARHAKVGATEDEQKAVMKIFRKSLSCTLKSGKAKPFGAYPKPGGGEDTAFMKTFERTRKP